MESIFPLPTYASALKRNGCKANLCKWTGRAYLISGQCQCQGAVWFLACCFRQTLSTSPGGCPSAQHGLLPKGKKLICGHPDLHTLDPLLASGCLHLSPVGTLELALLATLTSLSSSLADLGIFRRAAMVLYTDCIQQCSRPMYMVGDFSHRSTSLSIWSLSSVQKKGL